ncbi:AmiS/UreI family transporter [Caldinitratiruptor microaerophilus]|uniref:Transporter protein AmiS n=1 Tax=Caldinitratiruptor microaerophilus TaxID=671077 RepID=A0AA35CM69_9FIRM|nr:AmiS/UreI family transporter [Caldinitratiruptor microaerophilus]BDG59891.1 putative transporter protein AmiS [Caldinitratiruptor microaerophilus]
MLGLGLLYVGAVLFLNALSLLGRVSARGASVMNFFTGVLTFIIAMYTALARPAGDASYFAAAQTLLFSFTYLWVAINGYFEVEDGSALGWYCLFVAAVTVPTAALTFAAGDLRFGLIWLAWGFLWFLFWLLLALKRNLARFTAYVTLAEAVLTCMVPGFLILTGRW